MFRILLRVIAILFLLGGLVSVAIAGYLLITPSDEQRLYDEKHREMTEKYEKSRATSDPVEKQRLLKESKEAEGWAEAWGEGARTRQRWHILGAFVSGVVVFLSIVIVSLTFIRRKRIATTA
jgi:hypothetical protein